MGKLAASIFLKLFINGNEKCHFTDALADEQNTIFKCKQHKIYGPKGREK